MRDFAKEFCKPSNFSIVKDLQNMTILSNTASQKSKINQAIDKLNQHDIMLFNQIISTCWDEASEGKPSCTFKYNFSRQLAKTFEIVGFMVEEDFEYEEITLRWMERE